MQRFKEKLKFQAWHRGTRENDLLLGQYADLHIASFSPSQLQLFSQLLQESDLDIFRWIIDKEKPLDIYQNLIKDIIDYYAQR